MCSLFRSIPVDRLVAHHVGAISAPLSWGVSPNREKIKNIVERNKSKDFKTGLST